MPKEKLSYKDIGRMLQENGWRETEESGKHNHREYEMEISLTGQPITLLLYVAQDDGDDFDEYCDFGIACIGISKFDIDYPFFRFDLEPMLHALDVAEENLLALGVPFVGRYEFSGKNVKSKLRRNNLLRNKFNIPASVEENCRNQWQ